MFDFTLDVIFHIPITHLFEAFRRTDLLIQWFAPGHTQVVQIASDFEEGGRYRIVMREPDGQQYVLTGEYTTIAGNEQLVFSWAWEDNLEESVITSVNIKFEEVDHDTTAVILNHTGFVTESERDQHRQGWIASLEKLSIVQF